MQADEAAWPDWRDAAAYAPLLRADRSLHAWEWLRRDPRYRQAAADPRCGLTLEEFGLVAFESPALAVPHARPFWTAKACPFVLATDRALVTAAEDLFDCARLRGWARLLIDDDGEHLLLCDGFHAIRLDGPSGLFSGEAEGLCYRIAGLSAAAAPLLTLRRFLALCRTGRFPRDLHRREPRAWRWILMLRTHDALCAGASHREIAEILLSPSVADARWRIRESSIRSRVQRLVHAARKFAGGDHRKLLE